jgi:hypothetical protein
MIKSYDDHLYHNNYTSKFLVRKYFAVKHQNNFRLKETTNVIKSILIYHKNRYNLYQFFQKKMTRQSNKTNNTHNQQLMIRTKACLSVLIPKIRIFALTNTH